VLAVELEGHALGLAFEVPALVVLALVLVFEVLAFEVLACVEANHDVVA
jgi:hypothetical protein